MVSDIKTAVHSRGQVQDWMVGTGLALVAFGLYLATLAPTVLEADGGEFQFVPWLPGIAHPTGYPLYILLGWLWTHLFPIGEIAWRMNLLSAVLAAAAVGLMYTIARQMLDWTLPDTPRPARIIAAVVSATAFAASHTFWSQALIAEVYALHALFVAAILWLALNITSANEKTLKVWQTFRVIGISSVLLALTLGLSLTHHRTIVLLLPALVLFLLTADRTLTPTLPLTGGGGWRSRVNARLLLTYTTLLLAPLLLYLYLPLIAPTTPYAVLNLSQTQQLVLYDNSLQGFWNHIMGSAFGGEIKLTATGLDRLDLTWQLLRQQIGWVGAVLALAGLVTLWQRRQTALLLLTGLGFAAIVAFNLVYFIGDVFVLFIPAWLLVCLWLGLGSLGTAHWLAQRFVQDKTGSVNSSPSLEALEKKLGQRIYEFVVIILAALALLLPLVLLLTRYGELDQSRNTSARERWQAILAEPIPEGAVLLSNDRNEIMPLWYKQYVEGQRPDLLGLFPLITPEPAYADIGRVLDQALASGRPVYLIKPMPGLEIKANLSPAGSLFRATPYGAIPTHVLNRTLPEITLSTSPALTETISLAGYDLAPAQIRPGVPFTVTLDWQAIQPLSLDYSSYVHLVDSNGQGVTQSDHRPGGDFYPSHYWQPGETLHDQHLLTVPPTIPPGAYRLQAGMYYQPEPGVIKSMGAGVEMGTVLIK